MSNLNNTEPSENLFHDEGILNFMSSPKGGLDSQVLDPMVSEEGRRNFGLSSPSPRAIGVWSVDSPFQIGVSPSPVELVGEHGLSPLELPEDFDIQQDPNFVLSSSRSKIHYGAGKVGVSPRLEPANEGGSPQNGSHSIAQCCLFPDVSVGGMEESGAGVTNAGAFQMHLAGHIIDSAFSLKNVQGSEDTQKQLQTPSILTSDNMSYVTPQKKRDFYWESERNADEMEYNGERREQMTAIRQKKHGMLGNGRGRAKGGGPWSHLSEDELKKLRRVKNRESVEKCRTKQRLRMEALQIEQACLTGENKTLREVSHLITSNYTQICLEVAKVTGKRPDLEMEQIQLPTEQE